MLAWNIHVQVIYFILSLSLPSDPSPPTEVFVISNDGGQVIGSNGNILLNNISPPTTLNNINRTLYYYNSERHAIYKTSLDVNAEDEVSFHSLSLTLFCLVLALYKPRHNVCTKITSI